MHAGSVETNTSRAGPIWVCPGMTFIIVDPTIDLGFVNSLQAGAIHFPSSLHRGLVLKNLTRSLCF